MQPDEVALLNSFFNKQINHIWNLYHWVDICPYGEYRVPNNILDVSKKLTTPYKWVEFGINIQSNWGKNPVDNNNDAWLITEDATSGYHGVKYYFDVTYPTSYTFSVFLHPVSTQYVNIGVSNIYANDAVVDLVNAKIISTGTGVAATVNRISGGWVQVSLVRNFPMVGQYEFAFYGCRNGTTFSYPGTVGTGFGMFYPSASPTNLSGTTLQLIPWEQGDLEEIDVVHEVWRTSPLFSAMPKRCPYKVTPNGLQLYNTESTGIPYYYILSPSAAASSITVIPQSAVYLYYRKRCPTYAGPTYTTTSGYAINTTVYYTYADGVRKNYFKTIVATNAGDTPENAPEKFDLLEIPQFAFDFVVQGVLADWLMTERQFAKAQVVRMGAQEMMDREFDRQERQMGIQFPFKVHTHFTSRANPTR